MNRPFSISRGPSQECHCAFWTSCCRYIPLFCALHVVLSSDWLSWCRDCFSRHPWIPLIHPSLKICCVCRHFSFYPVTNLTWGCGLKRIPWDREITIKPRDLLTKEGFAESYSSILYFPMCLPEVGLWARYEIWWPILTVPARNQEVRFPGALGLN